MESTIAQSPVMLYTEETPNPESLKFVTNRMLYRGTADFREEALAREWSPLASALFDMPFVKGVYVADGGKIVHEGFAEAMAEIEAQRDAAGHNYSEEDAELVRRIRELIDTYVKPAVEMDGGNIEFKSFHNGIVTVILQGSCSGCPSSTVTLKAGIEGMLTRMIPEVKEVVSEMG